VLLWNSSFPWRNEPVAARKWPTTHSTRPETRFLARQRRRGVIVVVVPGCRCYNWCSCFCLCLQNKYRDCQPSVDLSRFRWGISHVTYFLKNIKILKKYVNRGNKHNIVLNIGNMHHIHKYIHSLFSSSFSEFGEQCLLWCLYRTLPSYNYTGKKVLLFWYT
jgi:hypothetical protein